VPTARRLAQTLGVMHDRDRTLVALETARAVATALSASLPTSLDPRQSESGLQFKALSVRELLIHRAANLGNAAVLLFERHDYLSGILLTRALLETVAVASALERALNRTIRTRNFEGLNKSLMRFLVPSAAPDANYEAMNITGLVEAVDKKAPGFRETYNSFSEYVHPNWSGMLGTYGQVDRDTGVLHLGVSESSAAWGVGVYALVGLLAEFQDIYTALPPLITRLGVRE
jgi:hypothetical protein